MIKTEVIIGEKSFSQPNAMSQEDYTYVVRLFGIIIHVFTFRTDQTTAENVFGKEKVTKGIFKLYRKRMEAA